MSKFKTEQEEFWAGDFGNEYTNRNLGTYLVAANTALFSQVLSKTRKISSLIELGANRGMNLVAIHNLLPELKIDAVEINQQAVEELRVLGLGNVYHNSILDFSTDIQYDLALSKGVLIHIDPQSLNEVYSVLYKVSRKYICLVEYYNPVPVEVEYRGNKNKLFKRDFAGDMLDKYPDLSLIDYGFVYHRDSNFPQDDLTWFLLAKKHQGR